MSRWSRFLFTKVRWYGGGQTNLKIPRECTTGKENETSPLLIDPVQTGK